MTEPTPDPPKPTIKTLTVIKLTVSGLNKVQQQQLLDDVQNRVGLLPDTVKPELTWMLGGQEGEAEQKTGDSPADLPKA